MSAVAGFALVFAAAAGAEPGPPGDPPSPDPAPAPAEPWADSCSLFQEAGRVVDRINQRYGKHRIFLGTGLVLGGVEVNERDEPCWRKLNLLEGESRRRRVRIPRLDIKV